MDRCGRACAPPHGGESHGPRERRIVLFPVEASPRGGACGLVGRDGKQALPDVPCVARGVPGRPGAPGTAVTVGGDPAAPCPCGPVPSSCGREAPPPDAPAGGHPGQGRCMPPVCAMRARSAESGTTCSGRRIHSSGHRADGMVPLRCEVWYVRRPGLVQDFVTVRQWGAGGPWPRPCRRSGIVPRSPGGPGCHCRAPLCGRPARIRAVRIVCTEGPPRARGSSIGQPQPW